MTTDYDLSGSTNVQVRMVRVSADETSSKIAAQQFSKVLLRLLTTNSVIQTLRLLDCVLTRVSSAAFPSRKYLIRGIKVKIPSNATVDTTTHLGRMTYSGIWDGTFQAATWTNDPAWILYDLLISTGTAQVCLKARLISTTSLL